MSRDSPPRGARSADAAATAAATGATSPTPGWPCCSIGVAASSSFQHSHDVILTPGQQRQRRRLHDPLRAADRAGDVTSQGEVAKLSFGAVLDVSKHGTHVTTLTTTRGFYPATTDPTSGRSRWPSTARPTARSACGPG